MGFLSSRIERGFTVDCSQPLAPFQTNPPSPTEMAAAQDQTGGVTQVLVHVSTFQGSIWYRVFEPQPKEAGHFEVEVVSWALPRALGVLPTRHVGGLEEGPHGDTPAPRRCH